MKTLKLNTDKLYKDLLWCVMGLYLKAELQDIKINKNTVQVFFKNTSITYEAETENDVKEFKIILDATIDLSKEYEDKNQFYLILTQTLFSGTKNIHDKLKETEKTILKTE